MINLTASVSPSIAHAPSPVEPLQGLPHTVGFSGLSEDGAPAHPGDWVAEDSFYVARPLCVLFGVFFAPLGGKKKRP